MTESAMTVPPTPPEIARAKKKYEKWAELFLDPQSPTYGNATQSALKVYKVKKYDHASSIGAQNYRKLKDTGLKFVEDEAGIPIKEWWKIAAAKAVKGSYEQTMSFMERLGIIDPVSVVPANQNNFQFNFADLAASFTQARRERGLPVNPTHNTLEDELKSNEKTL